MELSSANRLNTPLLAAGVALYFIALATWVGFSGTESEAAARFGTLLLGLPIALLAGIILLLPLAFLVGTIGGTPLLSFTYGLAAAKQNWRGIVGISLGLTTLFAMLAAAA